MIEKTYQPGAVESRIYAAWEAAGAFRAGRPERAKAQPYCIVIPPPNVTGSLHMGHALNNTLQDILCRFERMRGRDVLWQPGTDHAGIATQAVVERQLAERGEPSSREMGREAFIKRVWEWKAESGGVITSQLKRLGASCDWSRERFTMDEGLSRAVLKVFVALYREGLIYKDKRLVNWDPKLKTAISDLEVQQVETKGQLWYIKYPVEGSDEFVVVATTRPETMLGDVAVAIHPHNERLKHLIGKTAILPLVGRRIPIIGDEYADPEKGSGAVKITPAHDFNDFEIGRRHGLPLINVFDAEAHLDLTELAAARSTSRFVKLFGHMPRAIKPLLCRLLELIGMSDFVERVRAEADLDETLTMHGTDRFAARKKIVERLEAKGLVEKIEPNFHVVPHGDRSNAVVEPFLTDQWYVNAKKLAEPTIAAVRERKTVFVPPQWEATFFNWMENIQPWCVSRQIWWGHQIPAWYGPKLASQPPRPGSFGEFRVGSKAIEMRFGPSSLLASAADDFEVFVAESESEAVRLAEERYGTDIAVHVLGPSEDGPAVFRGFCRKASSKYFSRSGCARHLVLFGVVAVLDARLAGWDAGAETLLPDLDAGYRLRHHFLLGRAHDDDGAAFHERGAVPRRLHPRFGARCQRRENVEVEGQRHRSVAGDRRIRRRCPALHARRHGGAGPRHQALGAARRGLSQFRDQAVERGALRRDE